MELQHRLARKTIDIAVNKAIEDMKSNSKRGIRNLIDMGLLFLHSENQKWFLNAAKRVISNPKNPYNEFALRLIQNVDNKTIRTVGINLGCSGLTYGASRLAKRQPSTRCPVSWFMIFDLEEYPPETLLKMERAIYTARDAGAYCYLFRPRSEEDVINLCAIANRFGECLFVFYLPSCLITPKTTAIVSGCHNIVICVPLSGDDPDDETEAEAFRILRQNGCLFGFCVSYGENNIKKVTSPHFIGAAIKTGSIFFAYLSESGTTETCADDVYRFACRIRGEHGEPVIPLEWRRDMQYIGSMLHLGDYITVREAELKALSGAL